MIRGLVSALLFKDIPWWQWTGTIKFFLWLSLVVGLVGLGLIRLDRSVGQSDGREDFPQHVGQW